LSPTVTVRFIITKCKIPKNGPLNEKFQRRKIEKVSTRQLAHEQFFRRKGDDSKFLNGGRCHVDVDVDVDVNAWFTLIFF
jgi:hypothetical protein